MKLEVGCGTIPEGDVNVDLYTEPTGHRTGKKNGGGCPLPTKHIPNFVKADAHHLPFRGTGSYIDKKGKKHYYQPAFDIVYSCHTIEHVTNPSLMLDEMLRVAKFKIEIKCPHFLGDIKSVFHLNHFKKSWFTKFAQARGLTSSVLPTEKYRCYPHEWLCLVRVPQEIRAVILKGKVTKGGSNFRSELCSNCSGQVVWKYRAWDLDENSRLVHFGYWICTSCGCKSGLTMRKFKLPARIGEKFDV